MARFQIGVLVEEDAYHRLFPESLERELAKLGEVHRRPDALKEEDTASEILAHCEVVIGAGHTLQPTRHLLGQYPGLRLWIHTYGDLRSAPDMRFLDEDFEICSCRNEALEQRAQAVTSALVRELRLKQPGEPLERNKVVVLSSGGEGVAISRALEHFRAKVTLVDPTLSKNQAKRLKLEVLDTFAPDVVQNVDAVVVAFGSAPAPLDGLARFLKHAPEKSVLLFTPAIDGSTMNGLAEEVGADRLVELAELDSGSLAVDLPSRAFGEAALGTLKRYRDGHALTNRVLPPLVELDWSYVMN